MNGQSRWSRSIPELSFLTLVAIFVVTLLTKTYGVIIGGASFILQPFLIMLGIPPQMAVAHDVAGTNGTALSGIYVFRKSGHIQKDVFIFALPGLLLGPFAGVYALAILSEESIENFIALICCAGALYLLFRRSDTRGVVPHPPPVQWKWMALLYGFFIGVYTGFSGAGMGIVSGLLLIYLFGMTVRQSVATKYLVHAIPFVTSTVGYIAMGWLQPGLFIAIFAGCLGAGWLGSHLTMRLNEKVLRFFFLSAAILMAALILFK